MATLLRIDSSALSQGSNSKYLADQYQAEWLGNHPQGKVIHHDLGVNPPSHLSEATIQAMYTPAESRSADQNAQLNESNQALQDMREADTLLISAPMYNFGIPSSLKAYLDQVVRVGETFTYTENGPKGLLEGKQAIVILTSGGNYTESPYNQFDHVTPYLNTVLGFIGITDVKVVAAPDMANNDNKSTSLNRAEEALLEAV
ncbi:FMN-dependent NADH-azoreductase [Hydrogenovibrio marinus]|uniref:FMN dependent NADH:quinone oxidoreductase n=1 Tax=Hydrogenovibrio marinus TaxID=28885 RepID=A0A067A0S7_HYDMR|nr:NAD(P)H-dependent oxidoreductase [Hydrogenovibrio marinus]KDN96176.1 FMN-dependent NADH-azoreductase [Hydrogenovibrio marinus]BBN60646.1 FMN-dependent NADH-azoreductase [Hydrogenovibrio marinus]